MKTFAVRGETYESIVDAISRASVYEDQEAHDSERLAREVEPFNAEAAASLRANAARHRAASQRYGTALRAVMLGEDPSPESDSGRVSSEPGGGDV